MDLQIETMADGENKIKDLGEGKKILDVIEKYYPGHDWFVNCCHFAGTASIQLMYEGADKQVRLWKYGYVLHLHKLALMSADEYEKKIRDAGGEVLERYHLARGAINGDNLIDFFHKGIDTSGMVQ